MSVGCDTLIILNLLQLDMKEVSELQFGIYPNPASDRINLWIEAGQFDVIIREISGRLISSTMNQRSISLQGFANGSYIMEVSDRNGNRAVRRFEIVK